MSREEATGFLRDEYQLNRQHGDHINDHRLEFLKFFAGFVASVIGATQFLMLQVEKKEQTQLFVLPLLTAAVVFGLLSLLVLANYWISRDYMRLRNDVASQEIRRLEPDVARYLAVRKNHVRKIPDLRSMYALVSLMVVLANQILLFLILSARQASHSWLILTGGFVGQLLVVLLYRRVTLGPPIRLPEPTSTK